MKITLIGSSNVQRFFKKETFVNADITMIKCTKWEMFELKMSELESSTELAIISVVENLICDHFNPGPLDEAQFERDFDGFMEGFMKVLAGAAARLPKTNFVISKMLYRAIPEWFRDNFDELDEAYLKAIKKQKLTNISIADMIPFASVELDKDMVHLTKVSGEKFVWNLVNEAIGGCSKEEVNRDDDDDDDMETEQTTTTETEAKAGPSGSNPDGKAILEKIKKCEKDIESLNTNLMKIEAKRWADCLVSARMREEIDAMANAKKEDRVVVTGLTANSPPPINFGERKKWFDTLVKNLIERVAPGSPEGVLFINQGRSNEREIPMAEIRFRNREMAFEIRKTFVAKIKAGEDFGRVHIANSVTLGTRVRVDIMKAIVQQFKGEDGLEMKVQAYSSRPTIQCKSGNDQRPVVMTFADAIEKYGKRLNEDGLAMAYNRTGMAFKEQLQMNFVVLKDLPRPTMGNQTNQPGFTWGKKRPLEGQSVFFARNGGPEKKQRGGMGGRGGEGGSGFGPRGRGNTGGGGRGGKATSFWQGK